MNAERYERVREIFLAASEREGSERAAYLEHACAGDATLRADVDRLLPHLARAENFLATPALGAHVALDDVEDLAAGPGGGGRRAPLTVGPYVLGRLIGEGGFGAVYEAQQTVPVRRRVALKVLKPGMDSAPVLARFAAERRALELMDHPGIAKVLDAGETADGRPFFAMEFVAGSHLDAYCAKHALGTRERLALFQQVCEAIQHAHHKGVIHRDIKPSNVLVQVQNGRPQVKVIDFGIAKAIQAGATGDTLLTSTGQFVGTPAYMSPEQVDARDVDTRSDVYSLGVLLYELLAGAPPFDVERLRRAGLAEIMRILREEEPPKPSTRAGAAAKASSPVNAPRERELRGDLDWIAMKALEKDRERRYGTPTELAADVERHLKNEPVVAGPPTAIYRLRKFARRNAAFVAAATLIFVSISLGGAGTLWQARNARRDRDLAQAAELIATDRQREAEVKANTLLAVLQFIQDVFGSVRPAVAQGRTPTVREVLDSASERLARDFDTEPQVEAEIRGIVGGIYRALGRPADARAHLERARALRLQTSGPDSPEALYALNNLAALTAEEGRVVEAEAMYRESLATSRRIMGEEHLRTLTALNNLAQTLRQQGRTEEAVPLLREALALRLRTAAEDDAFTLAARNNLAGVLATLGDFTAAEPILRDTLAIRRRVLGDTHPDTLDSVDTLAVVLAHLGRNAEADKLFREEVDALRLINPPHHPQTLGAEANLAGLRLAGGDAAGAEFELRRVHDALARQFGAADPRALDVAVKLGWSLCALGRADEAAPLFESAETGLRRARGAGHPSALRALVGLATASLERGELSQAESMFQTAIELHGSRANGLDGLLAKHGLAETLRRDGRLTDAEPIFLDVLSAAREVLPPDHWQRAVFEADWARCLFELGRYDEAEPLIAASDAHLSRALGADQPRSLRARELLEEVRRAQSRR